MKLYGVKTVYLRSTCRSCNDTITLHVNEHTVTKVVGWVITVAHIGLECMTIYEVNC